MSLVKEVLLNYAVYNHPAYDLKYVRPPTSEAWKGKLRLLQTPDACMHEDDAALWESSPLKTFKVK